MARGTSRGFQPCLSATRPAPKEIMNGHKSGIIDGKQLVDMPQEAHVGLMGSSTKGGRGGERCRQGGQLKKQ